jgi:hypothetical protein
MAQDAQTARDIKKSYYFPPGLSLNVDAVIR